MLSKSETSVISKFLEIVDTNALHRTSLKRLKRKTQ